MTTLGLRDLGFLGGLGTAVGGYSPTHPETINWQSRVASAGGTASAATLQAMDAFCTAIDAQSGLRGAITRLNLFCGDQLAAALVPLYLAESAGATAKGNATDVNSGTTLFSSSNYSASGSSGGITANGASYLNSGLFNTQCATSSTGHVSFSGAGFTTSEQFVLGTTKDNAVATIDDLPLNINAFGIGDFHRRGSFGQNMAGVIPPRTSYAHFISSQTSSTFRATYENGSQIVSNTGSQTVTLNSTHPYFIFATNVSNTSGAGLLQTGRLRLYSLGNGLTAAQAAAFSAAVAAFNTALGR